MKLLIEELQGGKMRIKLTIPLTLSEISELISGEIINENIYIEYISTDTRELYRGDLFIAIKGEYYDGADFLSEAEKIGAYTLSQNKSSTIFAENVDTAILKLISFYKSKLKNLRHTILITGSVGKTSAKEFLYKLCIKKYKTHATHKNYNNIYGVMHTVLSANADTEVLIIEIGMNKKGEIKPISLALWADIAIITNIGSAHIGKLGSREAIADAKLEICEGLNPTALTFIPEDELLLQKAKNPFLVSFNPSHYTALIMPLSISKNGSYFDFYSGNTFIKNLYLKIPGEHILKTFSLALSVAVKLKIPENELRKAMEEINETDLRQKFIQTANFLIYDDSYSSSYEALIETTKMLLLYKKSISLVLSDILELGKYTYEIHYKSGYELARLGIKQLFLTGNFAEYYRAGAIDGGMKKENIHINNIDDGYQSLKNEIYEHFNGEILLVKGSHKTNLHELIKLLKENGG